MAKRTRIYACCTNQRCHQYQATLTFLQTWGLEPVLEKDKDGQYFDVSPPHYWMANRRTRFAAALKQHGEPGHRRS